MEPKLPPRETVELVRACEKRVCSTQEHFGCIYGDDGCIDCVERLQADYDATIELLLKKSEERACTQQEVEKLQRRLSDAMKYIPHCCDCCGHLQSGGRCALLPEGDEFSVDYTEGYDRDDCEHWELRIPTK